MQGNSKGLPKWEPRAHLRIYLGHSPTHAGSVALVMNPKTGLVSPQFHVVFDDTFSTVPHIRSGTVPPNWAKLVRDSSELVTDQEYDLTRTWFEGVQDPSADTETEDISEDISNNNQNRSTQTALPQTATGSNSTDSEGGPETDSTPVSEGDEELRMPKMVNLQESGLRRSPRLNARKALTTLLTAFFCSTVVPQSVQTAIGFTTDAISKLNRAAHHVEMNFDSTFNISRTMHLLLGKKIMKYIHFVRC